MRRLALITFIVCGLSFEPLVSANAQAWVPEGAAERCAAMLRQGGASLGDRTTRVALAALNAATKERPENCEILGVMRERTGTDGQHYAVNFRLRLPTEWNRRFLFQGGGGTEGSVGEGIGALRPGLGNGLVQGYATVTTDTGHDNTLNNDPRRQGSASFAYDYQARLEYAETSLDSVATAAKRLILAYYGEAPRYSYFVGCSNGGRAGMVLAQRFPDQFDGIVAESPAFAFPKAAIAEAWDTQIFAALARREGRFWPDRLPDISRIFSGSDLALAAQAVIEACDELDGLADGMVQDFARCTTSRVRPALNRRTCFGPKTSACLSTGQVQALVRSFGGPRDSLDRPLYADWPWDTGIATPSWQAWKFGLPGQDATNIMLGGTTLSAVFVTPPVAVEATPAALLQYQLDFDFDRDAPKIFATSPGFPRSGWDLVGAQSTDLSRFRAHGGKMVVPHGGSDQAFSVNDTAGWWQKLDRSTGGHAADFVRVFEVPGMNHCIGGPATDQFDDFKAVVDWVEKGVAPDRILATAGALSPWPGRTRPLCPYPAVARYHGGDKEQAASFVCERPRS